MDVARIEGVVGALRALGEAGDASRLAYALELLAAAGDELVRVALMPDVPYDGVARGIEDPMHREGELDDAEVGG